MSHKYNRPNESEKVSKARNDVDVLNVELTQMRRYRDLIFQNGVCIKQIAPLYVNPEDERAKKLLMQAYSYAIKEQEDKIAAAERRLRDLINEEEFV